ncbi:MAG: DUF4136 domain-containing protein [Kangiellaceae bacterium]|nr:DUF4136 domain-containing protein [Kangiellaceae bacterium]MCW8997582.1 DUF4136 domain-containing protein [Kangiellaceae bacterium]
MFSRIKVIFLFSVVLSGCAIKPPTTYDYDTSYSFAKLKSYAWIVGDEVKVSTLDGKRQKNAIETVLNRKGFVKVDSEAQADFLLKTHTVTDKKVDVDRFYRNWGYHPFFHPVVVHPHFVGLSHNTTTIVREYKVGTLVLDIVDPKLKQVIWRGTVAKPLGIYKNRSPEERATIAMSNAGHLLINFPPLPQTEQ